MAGVALGEWPMVGRGVEVGIAHQALQNVGRIVVSGVAGVGKTRLARELLQRCKSDGMDAMWVAGSISSARVPFGAFANHLRNLRTRRGAPARDNLEVLLGAQQAIVERAVDRRLLLAVDDAHLLDEASARLTVQLASSTHRVSVALTVREGKLSPDTIATLWEEGITERIELRPLSRSQIAKILEVGLHGEIDGLLVQQAWEACAGNLLYLRELVEAALETGRLGRVDGMWRLTAPLVTSDRLQGLIRARFANVETSTRDVLEILALGEPLDRHTLGLIADVGAIEDAQRRGLLAPDEEDGGPVVRLAHPLYGEVLQAGMPFTRRRVIARELADALDKNGASQGDDLLRYVLWRLDGGEVPPPDLLLQAARRALEAKDLSLAERLSRESVGAGGAARARIVLAIVHYRQARGEEALADLEGINPGDDELELTEVAVLRASVLFWVLGRVPEAEKVLADSESCVERQDCRAWLVAVRAAILGFAGRLFESIALAAPVAEQGDLPPRPVLAALSAVGPAMALAGRGDEAVEIAERGFDPELRAADEVGGSVTWPSGTMLLAHFSCGRLDDAERLARLQYETALGLRSPEAKGPGAAALGLVALLRGKVATAASWFREGELGLRVVDLFGIRILCLGGLVQALASCGDDEAAARVLSEAEQAGRPGIRWFDSSVEIGRAWLVARTNRAVGAQLAVATAETAEASGQLSLATWAYHAAARIAAPTLATDRLTDLAHRCQGPLPPAMALHASALAAKDGEGLLHASHAFEELGMLLLAAEAAATGAGLEARQGRRAGPLRERAGRLVAECEGAWSPALEDLWASPASLSPREMAVARLAREARSSPEIAGLLGISVRTVDSHMANIYLKLGIAGRADLAQDPRAR